MDSLNIGFDIDTNGTSLIDNLLRSTTSRASSRTVIGYATGDSIADGQSLLTVPANIGAYPGLRLATTAADGAALGGELWDDGSVTTSGTGWVYNGDGTWTHAGTVIGELRILAKLSEGLIYHYDVELLSGFAIFLKFGEAAITGNSSNLVGVGTHTGQLPAENTSALNAIRLVSSVDGVTVGVKSIKQVLPTWKTTDASGAPLTYTGQSIADQSTNMIWPSEDLTTNWSINAVTTATKLVEATTTGLQRMVRGGVGVDNIEQTFYADMSQAGRHKAALFIFDENDTSSYIQADIDLITKTISAIASGGGIATSAELTELYDGVFRVSVTGTPNTAGDSGPAALQVRLKDDAGNQSYTGDGVSGITIPRTQFETGKPSPYIPTTTATASTIADKPTILTAGLPITAQQGAIELALTPDETGQSSVYSVVDESFTSSLDVAVALDHSSIVTGTAVVTSSDGLTTFTEGTDYTIDYAGGTVTVLSTGTMADAATYLVDYDYSMPIPTVISSYIDSSNYMAVYTKQDAVIFRKKVLGVDYEAVFTYTHTKDTKMRVDLKYDKTNGIAIRAADYSADISLTTWATNANTADIPLASTFHMGNVNDTSFFKALYADPKFYQDDSLAGWL